MFFHQTIYLNILGLGDYFRSAIIYRLIAHPELLKRRSIPKTLLWPAVTNLHGKYILAYPHWAADNYYHWMLEFLPRLAPIIDPSGFSNISDNWTDCKIILPPNNAHWMSESLQILGLHDNQLYRTNGRQLRVEKLYYVSSLGSIMNTPIWAIKWLRSKFMLHTSDYPQAKQRIYISRKKASKRRAINECEVEFVLTRYGFVSLVLEDLTVMEQISYFQNAEIIVAPHGAGLTNIIFSDGVSIIEFLDPSWFSPTFFNLSIDCKHKYWFVLGQKSGDTDIFVDISTFQEILENCLTVTSCRRATS